MNDLFTNRGVIDAILLLIGVLMVIIILAGLIDLFLKRKAKQKAIVLAKSRESRISGKEAEKTHTHKEALKKREEEGMESKMIGGGGGPGF
ncbi:MAG: hypothetical protein ACXACX_12365 [Candidatus Hodarchaeales archaeon]